MHEARIRQALKWLESDTSADSIKTVCCALLIAAGYDITSNNVNTVRSRLVEHIAQFAPRLDDFDLE